ncbi:malate dehydrogenase [Spironucleus salmonicida]|uniref:Malate dehydrogenase n=1 Tax=Spironucleus salmonicida TaxID=348837 RepID=K7R1I6_9EUKA|nr:malic enzyme [Spironucleus salmonicida]KAH0572401.1 malate dehydrogenase [Spironucleus salmonicida]|eukprot:EST41462.1 Malic enzyme [Spironucleus salmonicida]
MPLENRTNNKDTAFTTEERKAKKIVARLPYKVETIEQQSARVHTQMNHLETPIEKWMYLTRLQETNETLYCYYCLNHLKEVLPVVYTPTVGTACKTYSDIWQQCPRGLYLNRSHQGQVKSILKDMNYTPQIIVATDGTRILGLGDLGTGGHQICVGKLALYTLGGGFAPEKTLPISFDFGCNVDEIKNSEHYLGIPEPRNKDAVYYAIIKETIDAVHELWPECVFQFEDFSNDTAFVLLEEHRSRAKHPVFNDDIQGTGCIAAASLASALKACSVKMGKKVTAREQIYVLYGAGAGGIGVADNIAMLSVAEGATVEQARKQFYVVDTKGLITKDRADFKDGSMASHKLNYARDDVSNSGHVTLMDVIKAFKPTTLLGLSTIPKSFNQEVIETVCSQVAQPPIVLALSNPTVKCELTNQECYDFSKGKAFYASGSPFPPVKTTDGKFIETAQCNNFYCFPGIGLGAHLCAASEITDLMIVSVSNAIADCMSETELASGQLLPKIEEIREVSAKCALAIIRQAEKEGKATKKLPTCDNELMKLIKESQWQPRY